MKKWLSQILLVFLVLSGCSQAVTENPSKEDSVSENKSSEQEKQKDKDLDKEVTNKDSTTEKTVKGSSKITSNHKKVSEYPTFEATVVSVIDGDTFKISYGNKEETVRLLLVDTPETKHPRLGVQKFGPEASAFTKSLLRPGTKVLIETDISERDKYGRLLAYVYVNGKMINELLLEKGLARVAYVYVPNTRYVDRFREIQDKARQQRVGIWSIEDYVHEDGFGQGTTTHQSNATQSKSNSYTVSNHPGGSFQNNPADDKEANTSCKGKIKGNANSKIYHLPGGAYYDKTVDNIVWFCTEEEAQKAGYRKSKR